MPPLLLLACGLIAQMLEKSFILMTLSYYIQETGCSGRDEKPSLAVVIPMISETQRLKGLIKV